MATFVKFHMVAVGLLLLMAPLVATAQLTEVSSATPELDLNRASVADGVPPLGIEEGATRKPIADRPYLPMTEFHKVNQSRAPIEKLPLLIMAGSKEAATSEPAAKTPPEPGMVWVNTETGVYHREGERWYGKTKEGKFMPEDDAKAAGYREAKR